MSEASLNWRMLPENHPQREEMRLAALAEARTAAFIQAAVFELFVIWNCRSEKHSVWTMGRKGLKNKFFIISVLFSLALTLAIPYIPVTQQMFHIVPMNAMDLILVIAVASLGLFVFPGKLIGKKIGKWE